MDKTCNKCACNKVCNHDLFGFENCGNFISAEDVVEIVHGEWVETYQPLGFDEVKCAECSSCGEDWIAEAKAKQEAMKKSREAAAKRMEQTRKKHMALLDVIFEFCQHEIPEKGCANCPLCPAKLGFDVCGGVNLTTARLQKAVEVIDKNERTVI